MSDVLKKMSQADYWFFGVPVHAKLPEELQNLINRTMPLFDPKVVLREGSLLPSRRKTVKLDMIALVSSCSHWGLDNFELLIRTFEFFARAFDVQLARPLLRPNADLLRKMVRNGEDCHRILDSAERTGVQFARDGVIRKDATDGVRTPLMTTREFMARYG
jgi:hypothetical protein